MLGSSAAREAGSAPLTLQQTAPHEDQENINPEKASPAQQPRTRARLAVLKAGNQRAPAPPQRPKTRRVKTSVVLLGAGRGEGREGALGLGERVGLGGHAGLGGGLVGGPRSLVSGALGCHGEVLHARRPHCECCSPALLSVGWFFCRYWVRPSPAACVGLARHHASLLAFKPQDLLPPAPSRQ